MAAECERKCFGADTNPVGGRLMDRTDRLLNHCNDYNQAAGFSPPGCRFFLRSPTTGNHHNWSERSGKSTNGQNASPGVCPGKGPDTPL